MFSLGINMNTLNNYLKVILNFYIKAWILFKVFFYSITHFKIISFLDFILKLICDDIGFDYYHQLTNISNNKNNCCAVLYYLYLIKSKQTDKNYDNDFSWLLDISDALRNNKYIMKQALLASIVTKRGDALFYIPEKFRNNERLIKKAVKLSPKTYAYATQKYKNNKDNSLEAVKKWSPNFENIPDKFKNDLSFVLNCLEVKIDIMLFLEVEFIEQHAEAIFGTILLDVFACNKQNQSLLFWDDYENKNIETIFEKINFLYKCLTKTDKAPNFFMDKMIEVFIVPPYQLPQRKPKEPANLPSRYLCAFIQEIMNNAEATSLLSGFLNKVSEEKLKSFDTLINQTWKIQEKFNEPENKDLLGLSKIMTVCTQRDCKFFVDYWNILLEKERFKRKINNVSHTPHERHQTSNQNKSRRIPLLCSSVDYSFTMEI
jgi:hypothetical protein